MILIRLTFRNTSPDTYHYAKVFSVNIYRKFTQINYQIFRIIKYSGLSSIPDYQILHIIKCSGLSNVPDYQTLPILAYVFTGYFLLSLL